VAEALAVELRREEAMVDRDPIWASAAFELPEDDVQVADDKVWLLLLD
jgi:hypothetical protein